MPQPRREETRWKRAATPNVEELATRFEVLMDTLISRGEMRDVQTAEKEMLDAYGKAADMQVVIETHLGRLNERRRATQSSVASNAK